MKCILLQYLSRNNQPVLAIQLYDQQDKILLFQSNELFTDENILSTLEQFSNKIDSLYYLVTKDFESKLNNIKSNILHLFSLDHEKIKEHYGINLDISPLKFLYYLYEKIYGSQIKDLEEKDILYIISIINEIVKTVSIKEIIEGHVIDQIILDFIKTVKNFNFTEEQKVALNTFKNFIDNPQSSFYILSGSAGTGKTTMIKYLLDFYYYYKNNKSYKLMAPTGKASRVLTQKTNITCFTIHKTIYTYTYDVQKINTPPDNYTNTTQQLQLELFTDYEKSFQDDHKIIEIQNLGTNTETLSFVVVDESSMITDFRSEDELKQTIENNEKNDKRLVNCTSFHLYDIIKYLKQQRNTVKIIFVGDPCQLPPVATNNNELFMPALNESFLRNKYKDFSLYKVHLKEAHRFANVEIYLFSLYLRNIIEQINILPFKERKYDYNFIEKFNDFHNKYPKITIPLISNDLYLINLFIQYYKKNNKTIIITHRNEAAEYYNFLIRNSLNKKYLLVENDSCVCIQNNYLFKVFNGEIFTIRKIKDIEFKEIINFEYKLSHVLVFYLCSIQTNENSLESYLVHDTNNHLAINAKPSNIPYKNIEQIRKKYSTRYMLKMEFKSRMKYHFYMSVKLCIEDIISKNDKVLDNKYNHLVIKTAKQAIIKYQIKSIEEIKKQLNLVRIIKDFSGNFKEFLLARLNNDPYFNSIIYKHSYAITCHKAQGSAWNNVFVADINKQNINWLYTAVTRASEKLILSYTNIQIPKINRPYKPIYRIMNSFEGEIHNIEIIEIISKDFFTTKLLSYFFENSVFSQNNKDYLQLNEPEIVIVETENERFIFSYKRFESDKTDLNSIDFKCILISFEKIERKKETIAFLKQKNN